MKLSTLYEQKCADKAVGSPIRKTEPARVGDAPEHPSPLPALTTGATVAGILSIGIAGICFAGGGIRRRAVVK